MAKREKHIPLSRVLLIVTKEETLQVLSRDEWKTEAEILKEVCDLKKKEWYNDRHIVLLACLLELFEDDMVEIRGMESTAEDWEYRLTEGGIQAKKEAIEAELEKQARQRMTGRQSIPQLS